MSLETQLRDQLLHHTDDVVGGPDLTASLRSGRGRRRVRRAVRAGGAGLGVAALVSLMLVLPLSGGDDDNDATSDGPTTDPSTPAQVDFVPGTDQDEKLVAIVAGHLPGAPTPDDVYPSDVHTAGPLPDSAFARATDFQAVYTLGAADSLLVFTGYGPLDEDPGVRGTVTTQTIPSDDGSVITTTSYVFADGFAVTALETVGLGAESSLDQPGIDALVQDPALRFPAPAGVPVHH